MSEAVTVRPLWRDPLLVFVAIGAALFLVYWALGRNDRRIEVPATVQQALFDDHAMMTGRAPDAAQKRKLIADYVSNEILFREAVARGMHLTDSTTRARLVDRLRFMIGGAPATPSEADLLDYYSEHTELYRAEPQISLSQVFFAKPPAAPAEVLAALNRGEQVRADDFWMGSSFPNYGESMLRGMFGTDVLDAARAAPIGTWVGPHLSPRGTHFLRVDARNPAALMRFTEVRDQVAQDMMAARTSAAVAAEVRKLEEAYDVHIQN